MFKKLFFIFTSLTSLFYNSNANNLRYTQNVPQYNFDLEAFSGDWLQVKTSHYVQTTSEIDWFCTDVNVTKLDNNTVKISISPRIHAIYYNHNKIVTTYYIENDNNNIVLNSTEPLLLRHTGPIIDDQYDYTILTGYDNVTLFVWARDFGRYYQYYDEEASQLIESWDYNTTYKEPSSVYSNFCFL